MDKRLYSTLTHPRTLPARCVACSTGRLVTVHSSGQHGPHAAPIGMVTEQSPLVLLYYLTFYLEFVHTLARMTV